MVYTTKEHPVPPLVQGPPRGGRCGPLVVLGGVLLACVVLPPLRDAVLQHGGEAVFWLALLATVFNPLPLLPEHCRHLAPPLVTAAWLTLSLALPRVGNPSTLFEWAWRAMTARFSLLQISVFGSALLHICLTLVLNVWPVMVQNLPQLQRYKIQQEKAPAGVHEWYHCAVHILASQFCVQLPLITLQYCFIAYFNIPHDYDTMPGFWSLAWRLALSLIIDDTWVYFGHRALHDKRIYKYIHKVHHTYTAPFAPDAEYEHPVETVFLGVGFFTACMCFTNHLAFMWAWLYMRLLVTYDSHSGYDLPFNMLHLIPCYNGAREHDWHHKFFNGMYAPTFVWWDRLFGTCSAFDVFERQRRSGEAAKTGKRIEQRGDDWYAKQGKTTPGTAAGTVDRQPASVTFETCLVAGSEGTVGARLVAMVAGRGARRVVCVDAVEGPTAAFRSLAERCRREHGAELVYVQQDSLNDASVFAGVEVVFNAGGLDQVGAPQRRAHRDLLQALRKHGRVDGSGCLVLVDGSGIAAHAPTHGDVDGYMEHDLARMEDELLAANGTSAESGANLATSVLTAQQVYAPEDAAFLSTMLESSRAGRLRLLGLGKNLASLTHADNLAHAMILAAAKLRSEGSVSPVAGELFVVTDGGAQSFWDVVNDAVVECGLTSLYTRLHVPAPLLRLVANLGLGHTVFTGASLKVTPSNLGVFLTNRTYCTAKARHLLGYAPVISFEDGWAETVARAKQALAPGGSKKAD